MGQLQCTRCSCLSSRAIELPFVLSNWLCQRQRWSVSSLRQIYSSGKQVQVSYLQLLGHCCYPLARRCQPAAQEMFHNLYIFNGQVRLHQAQAQSCCSALLGRVAAMPTAGSPSVSGPEFLLYPCGSVSVVQEYSSTDELWKSRKCVSRFLAGPLHIFFNSRYM